MSDMDLRNAMLEYKRRVLSSCAAVFNPDVDSPTLIRAIEYAVVKGYLIKSRGRIDGTSAFIIYGITDDGENFLRNPC